MTTTTTSKGGWEKGGDRQPASTSAEGVCSRIHPDQCTFVETEGERKRGKAGGGGRSDR